MKSNQPRALRGERLSVAISQALTELHGRAEGKFSFSRTELATYINESAARFGGTTTRQTLAIEPWVSLVDDVLKKLRVSSRKRDGIKAITSLRERVERLEQENAELRRSHDHLLRTHTRIFDSLREHGVDIAMFRKLAVDAESASGSTVVPFVLPTAKPE